MNGVLETPVLETPPHTKAEGRLRRPPSGRDPSRGLGSPHDDRAAPMTREAAEAILAGERPGDVRVVDDYPTEFSAGVARALGAERQFGSFLLHRSEDDFVVGEIGAAFIDEVGTLEIGYAVAESQQNRGYAAAAVEALVAKASEASEVRRIAAHTPLERPESGRVVEKAGFAIVREMDDPDEVGNVVRVKEWELEL